MAVINRIAEFQADMTAWRREIHAHPETAFEEHRTSAFVAKKLAEFGIEVHTGLAGTGVVGTLKGQGGGGRAIGLRADLDALHIHEQNDIPHKSQNPGRMHACGHDGHTTMLLGAAKYLAETRNFEGTVHFIFQPAEENEGGGRVMVEQGLFKKFPVEAVFGLHNWPGMKLGSFAIRPGPQMAAYDVFEIVISGKGAHGAMPHQGIDPVVVASQIVLGLQTIVSRNTHPLDAAVVSVTQIHGGDTWNVIPEQVTLRGTTRSFKPEVQDRIEANIRRVADGVCQAMGASMTMRYERRYPATINAAKEAEFAARVAADVVGTENVERDPTPSMGSEDFAFLLQACPGAYIWMGNGSDAGDRRLHSPHYDFNDEALAMGASYWARMAEMALPRRA
jgi:hippurate hydrolase